MGRRSDIDWEALERDYRLGHPSIAAVAKKHGVAVSTLKKKAKERGWARDLTPVVQAATQAAITQERADHAKQLAEKAPEIGREIGRAIQMSANSGLDDNVAAAAALGTIRNRIHASIAEAGLDVAKGIMEEIAMLNNADVRELIRNHMMADASEPEDIVRVDKALNKLFDISDRAKSLDTILAAAAKAVQIDRKANNLDDKGGGSGETIESLLDRIAESRE